MTTLDIERPDALIAYLQQNAYLDPDEQPTVTVLAGGVSNRTVLVERASGDSWVIKQALEKLRVTVDWFSSPARIHREAEGLRWLATLAPPGSIVPFIFEDFNDHLLAMQAVPQPHANWKSLLLKGQMQPDHVRQFGEILGTIHRIAWERRAEVEPAFADRSFFESLRLEPYYSYTAAQVPEAAVFLHDLIESALERCVTLVHGDYSPKNILVYRDRLILLDHEVIHFGDPAFDLGFSLTHLLSKAHHLADQRETFAYAARLYWQSYSQQVDVLPWYAEVEAQAIRHTLACLLARVAGRSPLEYLDPAERTRQRETVLRLMQEHPASVPDLIRQFTESLALDVHDHTA